MNRDSRIQKERRKISFDLPLYAATAQLTAGISPIALTQAYTDWGQHLHFSPDKQIDIIEKALHQWSRYLKYCPQACGDPHCQVCIEPLPQDKRFTGEAWQKQADHHAGSWWPCWQNRLRRYSGDSVKPPILGASRKGYKSLCVAPGTYVLET